MHQPQTEYLFIYGTLALEKIQLELFKRVVATQADKLKNYRKNSIRLPDIPKGTLYPILDFTGNPEDTIEGYLLQITLSELARADVYEGKAYARKRVLLTSGREAWCYVAH